LTYLVESSAPGYDVVEPTDFLPATFRMYFAQQGDNLSDPNDQWWAPVSKTNLGMSDNTTLQISVPLTSDQWFNLDGESNPQAFAGALQNIGFVGITFGGQYFAGDGVALTSGTAKFILINYQVN
jgi:hypothetical protein